jgi:hypothetical protein
VIITYLWLNHDLRIVSFSSCSSYCVPEISRSIFPYAFMKYIAPFSAEASVTHAMYGMRKYAALFFTR